MHQLRRVELSILLALLVLCVPVVAQAVPECRSRAIGPCATRHGRLSTQNGIARRIWIIGTTRSVAVDNEVETLMPRIVSKYLDMASPDHSYVYGDFEICPLVPDVPGHAQWVCVTGAMRLVVKTVGDSRPPFRVLSTWPSDERRGAGQ